MDQAWWLERSLQDVGSSPAATGASSKEIRVVKIVAFVRRRDDLSFEQFREYWQRHHAAVVAALPGLRRYVQNPALKMDRAWPYDGMAELWFDDVDAVRSAFRSEQSARVREDEPNFVKTIDWFLANEYPVVDQT